jgi:hypothetical protein
VTIGSMRTNNNTPAIAEILRRMVTPPPPYRNAGSGGSPIGGPGRPIAREDYPSRRNRVCALDR